MISYLHVQNGIATALPYATLGVMALPVGYLSDKLINSGKVSISVARKIFHCCGVLLPAAALVWLSFIKCDTILAIIAMCLSVGTNSLINAGCMVSASKKASTYIKFL